jgi:hypothetical protein
MPVPSEGAGRWQDERLVSLDAAVGGRARSGYAQITAALEEDMKIEVLLYIGAIFHLAWAVFDFFWPRFFNWKETLASLDDIQRVLPPITSRMLVVVYFSIAYISLFHTADLIATDLGRKILFFVSLYWVVRAIVQVYYIGFEKANEFNVTFSSYAPYSPFRSMSNKFISYLLFTEFMIISGLYLIPFIYVTCPR